MGPHSHAARLAGAMLGELLYETGELAEAMRLLDESYGLGPEGGGVDYLAAQVRGKRENQSSARRSQRPRSSRLNAGMKTAEQLRTAATRGRDQQRADPTGHRHRAGGGSPTAIRPATFRATTVSPR